MRKFRSLLVGALGLVAFLAVSANASAATITVSSGSSYTATARQTLTLDPAGLAIACDLSFSVALASTTITSAALPASISRLGSVTRGAGGNCSGGATLTLLNLPWQLDGSNGTGTADGTVLTIKNAQFQVGIGLLTCLYAGDVSGTVSGSGSILNVRSSVPLSSGSFLCPNPGTLQGTFSISPAIVLALR